MKTKLLCVASVLSILSSSIAGAASWTMQAAAGRQWLDFGDSASNHPFVSHDGQICVSGGHDALWVESPPLSQTGTQYRAKQFASSVLGGVVGTNVYSFNPDGTLFAAGHPSPDASYNGGEVFVPVNGTVFAKTYLGSVCNGSQCSTNCLNTIQLFYPF